MSTAIKQNSVVGKRAGGKERVVVLGTGWASFRFVHDIDTDKYDVLVISPRNHFLFTPLLASTTTGTLSFRSVIEPIRAAKMDASFHLAECTSIKESESTIECRNALDQLRETSLQSLHLICPKSVLSASKRVEGPQLTLLSLPDNSSQTFTVEYDKLIVGVGAIPNDFGIEGVTKYGFFLKELRDARNIRQRIIENFEMASEPNISREEMSQLLHFVVVGGGPTGVEFSGELSDFVREDIGRYFGPVNPHVRITLIEAQEILGMMDQSLRTFAMRNFHKKGVEVLSGVVSEVREKSITLKDGTEIDFGLLVWSTGVGPRPLIQECNLAKTERQLLQTDHFFQVHGTENVYAFGDCADIEDCPLPSTAQVAEQSGKYLAEVFNGTKDSTVPFAFENRGVMAYIGSYQAVLDHPHIRFSGFKSWFLWRTAYLTMLGSWKNRMNVPFDWARALLFGRDISRF